MASAVYILVSLLAKLKVNHKYCKVITIFPKLKCCCVLQDPFIAGGYKKNSTNFEIIEYEMSKLYFMIKLISQMSFAAMGPIGIMVLYFCPYRTDEPHEGETS